DPLRRGRPGRDGPPGPGPGAAVRGRGAAPGRCPGKTGLRPRLCPQGGEPRERPGRHRRAPRDRRRLRGGLRGRTARLRPRGPPPDAAAGGRRGRAVGPRRALPAPLMHRPAPVVRLLAYSDDGLAAFAPAFGDAVAGRAALVETAIRHARPEEM